MIGEILGNRYELIEKIGEGGMAIVYKARDNKLSRLVAVKILKKEFANNKDISDKFKKEATAVANFSDANIVNVLDVGHEEEGNIDYFVMEYVNGKTLKELIVEKGKLNYAVAISISIQIAKALECAHKNNIIHRDVKPQNILVTESGIVKVTDFGIAKSSTSATITNTTTIMGSAHYLSPEQAKGTFIDSRSDIYSLGIVLYEMVTGVLPFDGESPVTIALKHIQAEPTEPKKYNPSIPESLNNLIIKSMSKESTNRYQSCRELINDLQKIKENPDVIIGIRNNYEDERTIIMEPIRTESIPENVPRQSEVKKSYSKTDFENDYDDDYDDDENFFNPRNKTKKRKNNKAKTIIISVVIILAAIFGGIAFGSGLFNGEGSGKKVIIPNIIGMTIEDATKQLDKVGLKLTISGIVESDKEENTILETNPVVNTEAKSGDIISVKVSGGVGKITVPDLRDYEINYIKDLLTQKGLNWSIDEEYSENIKSGYLIDQYPERDTEVEKGSTIQLTVSKGPEVKLVTVSNYIGENVDKAKSDLEGLGLVVALQEQETDRESEDGIVINQSLVNGNKVSEGTKIILTYGKYKDTNIDVSDYLTVGMPLADAINSLKSAGISYSISGGTPPESDMNLYIVKSFTNKIKQGESVKIQVEKTKVTEPIQPSEGDTNTTNPEDGESTNVNASADSGSDNLNPASGN